ncbi:MAG: hypothetical protein ABSH47_24210 [Bryobacteraceae bacterium]|jgi:hypothetical protein
MDRKEFLNTCAAGLCACAAGSVIPASSLSAAETATPEDWRLRFVKERYARMLQILLDRMSKDDLNQTLHDVGTFCSSLGDQTLVKYRSDFDGFCKLVKQGVSGDEVTWDREKGIITMTSPERSDCFCPLNSRHQNTPPVVCNCSLGWQQHTWETLLQKKVRVELKEAVLRGGKRCIFEIHVGEPV